MEIRMWKRVWVVPRVSTAVTTKGGQYGKDIFLKRNALLAHEIIITMLVDYCENGSVINKGG
jgi:hypothetical protein